MIKQYLIAGAVIAALSVFSISSIKKNGLLRAEVGRKSELISELTQLVQDTQASYEKELGRREKLQSDFDEAMKNAKAKLDKQNSDLLIAGDESKRLQEQVRKARKSANSVENAIGVLKAADTTGDLCPDMFATIDDLATEYADYADRARIAGESCQLEYKAYQEYIQSRIITKTATE